MHTEFIISLNDLRFVSIECPHCGTRVTLDMSREDFSVGGRNVFGPEACAGCRKAFDSTVARSVDALHRVYKDLPEAVGKCITFSGRRDPDSAR
jgi:hypothetical protein